MASRKLTVYCVNFSGGYSWWVQNYALIPSSTKGFKDFLKIYLVEWWIPCLFFPLLTQLMFFQQLQEPFTPLSLMLFLLQITKYSSAITHIEHHY